MVYPPPHACAELLQGSLMRYYSIEMCKKLDVGMAGLSAWVISRYSL